MHFMLSQSNLRVLLVNVELEYSDYHGLHVSDEGPRRKGKKERCRWCLHEAR